MTELTITEPDGTSEPFADMAVYEDGMITLTKLQTCLGGFVLAASTIAGSAIACDLDESLSPPADRLDLLRVLDTQQYSSLGILYDFIDENDGSQLNQVLVGVGVERLTPSDQEDAQIDIELEFDTVVEYDAEEEFTVEMEITDIDSEPLPLVIYEIKD